MKILSWHAGERWRLALAVFGGVLLAAAFPKFGVAGLAWVAPGLILASGVGVDGRAAFRLGYFAGLAHYLTSLYWLLNIPVMKLAPLSGWLALCSFLALYPATWMWLCWRMHPGGQAGTNASGFSEKLEALLSVGWTQRVVWALSCAALWVTWEMVQARLFTGFPWNLLGASQYRMVPLLQVTAFTGVYGLSFLAVWFAVSLHNGAVVVLRRPQTPRRWMGEIVLPLLAAFGVLTYGTQQFARPATEPTSITVALVQPSIPQRWDRTPQENAKRFEDLLRLSESVLTNKPDVLVWPEAAVPGYVRWDTNLHHAVTNLVQRHKVWLILGADDMAPRKGSEDPFAADVFNSSFLVGPDGEFKATYRKRRLVIFGEYLPLVRWLPFLERWTGMGSFTPGEGPVPFVIPELKLKTSILICFEDIFPHHTPEYVDEDTDFLLNVTNNGWFGEGAAQWQHAANAVFRAVENRVPLVRCTNNGLTCWVDERGRMHDVYFPGTSDIYGAGFKLVKVPLLAERKREATFYRRRGDVFGWSCVVWAMLAVGWTWRRRSEMTRVQGPMTRE